MEHDVKYNDIRFFNDEEVSVALKSAVRHPMIKELFKYTFPEKPYDKVEQLVLSCNNIDTFQRKVISKTVERILETTSAGLTTSGFDLLDSDTSYLYISNHRDIVMDTCLLNVTLFEHDLIRTASAIGDNLVQRPFVNALSKLTRNFIVKRGASPRETLLSSKKLSEFIRKLIHEDNRSVWIAQRQGRTKDGNDKTEQGVLKMIAMATGNMSIEEYLTSLRMVPVSISYEHDPTDILKVPELLAQKADEEYIKSKNEDFNSIMRGALGQKKHIHLAAGQPFTIDNIADQSTNQVLQRVVTYLDEQIRLNYKLWPTNYIAHDLLSNNDEFSDHYNEAQKKQFERRISLRVDTNDTAAVTSFLEMYARPVTNKMEILSLAHG
jgi:hypothetical protein